MSIWSRFTAWLSGWPETKELEWFETEEEKEYLSKTGPPKDEKEE